MFSNIKLISKSVKILRFLSLLYEHNWRRYVCLATTTFLVFTQFVYMFQTNEGIDALIRNSYMLVLWFNTLLRAYMLLYDHEKYERLINDLKIYYKELKKMNDAYVEELLEDVNRKGDFMTCGNLFLGILTCIGFGCYPLLSAERVLPFGSIIPGVNPHKTPFYEVWFIYEMIITPMGCCMYIPFTSLIVAFIMFGIVLCKVLQYQLRILQQPKDTNSMIHNKVIECIKCQNRIIDYIAMVNRLTTYIFLVEFLAFGALLCALLFLLIIVNSFGQAIIVCAYITMILAQIFALYWYANELREQNLAIAAAAYEMEWFTFNISTQKCIKLIILRAQKPKSIMVGNIQPMTLELFQALLNASYTFFTLLKRVYS